MKTSTNKNIIECNLLDITYSVERIRKALEGLDGHVEMVSNMVKITGEKAAEFARLAHLIEIVQNKK